jgi:hypothetical protein
MVSENRRDLRYRAELSTTLIHGGETTQLLTCDVSFRGAFLVTELHGHLRQLVRVSFLLPDHHQVGGHAMVVHVLSPCGEGSRQSGIGIEFFGEISGRKRWDAFIQELTKDPSNRAT